MYIELWSGLRDLMHENQSSQSKSRAQQFINWSLKDVASEFAWPFLRGTKSFTPTANGTYDLNNIEQLTGLSANIYAIPSAAGDAGATVYINGKYINTTTSAYNVVNSSIVLSAGVSASASQQFSHIDSFLKPVTSGVITLTNGSGNVICTLGASDTYIANDIRKISAVVDTNSGSQVIPFDYNMFVKANPGTTNSSSQLAWDLDYGSQIRVMNISPTSTYAFNVLYQRDPKYLVNDYDRTEFPTYFYQDIIDYAYKVYGKGYEDEATVTPDGNLYQLKQVLIAEMIRKYTSGGDRKSQRILPRGHKRTI